jgi:hypothetical protein
MSAPGTIARQVDEARKRGAAIDADYRAARELSPESSRDSLMDRVQNLVG